MLRMGRDTQSQQPPNQSQEMTHCGIIKKRGFFGPQNMYWITAHEGLTEVQRYNTF